MVVEVEVQPHAPGGARLPGGDGDQLGADAVPPQAGCDRHW
jgi:hypothetical protein